MEGRISTLEVARVIAAVTQQKGVSLVHSAAAVADILLCRAVWVFWSCVRHGWAHCRTLSKLLEGLGVSSSCGDGCLHIRCCVGAVGFMLPAPTYSLLQCERVRVRKTKDFRLEDCAVQCNAAKHIYTDASREQTQLHDE